MATLRGKTVLITGASKGIGKVLAMQMAGLGAKVSLLARSGNELEDIRNSIRTNGGHCEIFACIVDGNINRTKFFYDFFYSIFYKGLINNIAGKYFTMAAICPDAV